MARLGIARLLSLLLLAPAGAAQAREGDSFRFSSGGMISGSSAIVIDLHSGAFTLSSRSSIPQAVEEKRAGVVDRIQLEGLRSTARQAVQSGLRSRDCILYEKRMRRRGLIATDMPMTMDYTPSMWFSMDGQERSASVNPGCWSEAARQIEGAAWSVAMTSGQIVR